MLPLVAEIQSDAPVLDVRSAARRTLRLEVSATGSTDATKALIHNLSESGLLLETDAHLQVGETLQVELPLAGTTTALVVWSRGKFAGCEFTTPLSKAAVSAALLLNPIQRSADPLFETRPRIPTAVDYDFSDEGESMSGAALLVSLLISLAAALLLIVALLTFPFSMI